MHKNHFLFYIRKETNYCKINVFSIVAQSFTAFLSSVVLVNYVTRSAN